MLMVMMEMSDKDVIIHVAVLDAFLDRIDFTCFCIPQLND